MEKRGESSTNQPQSATRDETKSGNAHRRKAEAEINRVNAKRKGALKEKGNYRLTIYVNKRDEVNLVECNRLKAYADCGKSPERYPRRRV